MGSIQPRLEQNRDNRSSPHYKEREEHVDEMKEGSIDAYAVVAFCKSGQPEGERAIKDFNKDFVFELGEVVLIDDRWCAEMVAKVSVTDFTP